MGSIIMAGNDFSITGLKDLKIGTSGNDGATNTVTPQTIPQGSDYDQGRTNRINNQKQFFAYTSQRTTVNFNSQIFDFTFGTTSGLNPYQKLASHQGKELHVFG